MDRKICMGDNSQYIENSERVKQTNYNNVQNVDFKEIITEEQWLQILQILKLFIVSDEFKKLDIRDCELVKNEVKILEKDGRKNGYNRIRNFLSDGANLVTVVPTMAEFISNHSDKIVIWIQKFFGM